MEIKKLNSYANAIGSEPQNADATTTEEALEILRQKHGFSPDSDSEPEPEPEPEYGVL